MTQAEKLGLALQAPQTIQMNRTFKVEVIDEQTGLITEIIYLPPGYYAVYWNLDLSDPKQLQRFVEDPNTSLNRLLRLPEGEA